MKIQMCKYFAVRVIKKSTQKTQYYGQMKMAGFYKCDDPSKACIS